jgi:hypothetical protein
MRCRVNIYSGGGTFGPSKLVIAIEDAQNVGLSAQANGPGQVFFTLPYSHVANPLIQPLLSHYEVQRQDQVGLPWVTIGCGLISDFDATPYDVIWYGEDYFSLFAQSFTTLKDTHTAQSCATVIQSEVSAAIFETNSRLAFISIGHIDTTGVTMTSIDDYKSRLTVIQNACQVIQGGTSARVIASVDGTPATGFTFNLYTNKGGRDTSVNLVYGGMVKDFHVLGGYRDLASKIIGFASKTSGGAIMWSEQSGLSATTYGLINKLAYFNMLPDQTSLDKMTLSVAAVASQPLRDIGLSILSGALAPSDITIANSYPVTLRRAMLNMDQAFYTLWGWQWYGRQDGTEDLALALLPEVVGLSAPPTPTPAPSPPASDTPSSKTYQVVKGDSINRIGTKFGVTSRALIAANVSTYPSLKTSDMIQIGWVLVIP